MDEAPRLIIEMHEWIWSGFRSDLDGLTLEEIDWRPVPEANTINLIVRHLRIDAPWHVAGIESSPEHRSPDAVPLDFQRNLKELDALWDRFVRALRATTRVDLKRQTALAYAENAAAGALIPEHLLGFHMAVHVARHWGQIRTLRNLYCTTRGEPARFFPHNPTFPTTDY